MGILDDAIRKHLELKRQHGAGDDDLERLEKEAFGPSTRPGDPDFADPAAAGGSAGGADAEPAAQVLGEDAPASSTAVAPLREPEAGEGGPVTAAEQARVEHAGLGETADHPAAPDSTGAERSAPMSEPLPPGGLPADAATGSGEGLGAEPPEAPERGIFDAEDIDFGDFDLDLDEEDEGAAAAPVAPEPSPFGGGDDDLSLDFEDEVSLADDAGATPPAPELARPNPVIDDTGNPPLPVPPREEEPAPPPPPAGGEEQPAEDLLEETPEFLRDTPEGDRAWFEQDPPKDFDFDD